MRIITSFTLAVLSALTLGSCDMAQDMAQTQRRSDAIATALEKELGTKPLVGWNIHNGTLTNVTVAFPLAGVERLPVGELEAKVRAQVKKGFEEPPQQLVVSVISTP